ncbi:MAG: CDP-alcohol phosphatidyltransferase family protein [Arenibacter latericius]|nr:CDP-alcohol phosphatidyltransferase family protein [Arenibacter latericius]
MSKLPNNHRFLDLSDYGRPVGRAIAKGLENTAVSPLHLTTLFIISGLLGVGCILSGHFWGVVFFLVLKSILDAADGELARIKNTPSYTGRYYDSIADIILNLFILLAIGYITNTGIIWTLLAFCGMQLQGTLYNYYYVILRNRHHGDTTSRVFEKDTPVAMEGEQQRNVDLLFGCYRLLYGGFDQIIYFLDGSASDNGKLPNWLMTAVSIYGLGFQLLLIGLMLVVGWADFIIPFFIFYTVFVFLFIGIRKVL